MLESKSFITICMVLSGTISILCIKWADRLESTGLDGTTRRFDHPYFQTAVMFFGQTLSLFVFKIVYFYLKRRRDGSEDMNPLTAGNRNFRPTALFLPAICDVIASTMLFIGLYLTYASSFQMLKGVALIFVAMFGVTLLNYTVKCSQWLGIILISIAVTLITIADFLAFSSEPEFTTDAKGALTGDLLIITSQIFHAFQFVYEEKYLKILDIPPLQAAGWEAIFGLVLTVVFLIPLNFVKSSSPFNNNAHGVVEDVPDAIVQLFNNCKLLLAHGIFIIFTTIYSASAIYITKHDSALQRVIVDMMRVTFLWIATAVLSWEAYQPLQVVGFLTLLCGVLVYRNVVFVPSYRWILGLYLRRRYGNLPSEEVTVQPADII